MLSAVNFSNNKWILFIAISLVILPFIGVENIAFIDYPNHLARYHIIENYTQSESLQLFYHLKSGFYPYWGMEGFMKIFVPFIGVDLAGRWFVICSLLTPVIGTLLIARAVHKKISFFTLAACIFIFSEVASWGFVNFLFTLGVAMCAFALWIQTERTNQKIRIISFSLIALIICAMHMISAGFLGLFIGFWELFPIFLARKVTKKDIIKYTRIAIIFIPALILIIMQSSAEFGGQDTFYGPIQYRIQSTQSPLNFMADLHRGELISMITGVGVLMFFIIARKNSGKATTPSNPNLFELDTRLLYMAAIFFCLSLIVPFAISGVAYVNLRFPLIATLLLCASVKRLPGKKSAIFTLIFAALLLTKIGWVNNKLSRADDEIKELRAAAIIIKKGSRVIPVSRNLTPDEDATISMVPLYYTHTISWLVIERDVLFPYLFSMFNVGINDDYKDQTVPHAFAVNIDNLDTNKANPYAKQWRKNYDYVLLMHFGKPLETPPGTTTVHQGSWFNILEIEKQENN